MGSSTYEWLLNHEEKWSYSIPTWVFTHRNLPVPEGADIRFVKGGVRESFSDIKNSAAGRDVWVMGGGDLAMQFAHDGLLDEMWVQIAPVLLGSGRPLATSKHQLELIEVVRNHDFACLRYSFQHNSK